MNNRTFKILADRCFTEHRQHNLLFEPAENKVLSYGEGHELIRLASVSLLNHGLRKGDMVLTFAPLSLEAVVLCWACFYTGIVFVPVDHNWPLELLQHILEETSPKLVLTDAERVANFTGNYSDNTFLVTGRNLTDHHIPSFFEWISQNNSQEVHHPAEVYPDDLAVILYTSGSTGKPKGVMLSQKALFNSGNLVATHFKWELGDVFMNLGDLHSMSGLRNTCFAPLHAGASFVIASPEERNNILLALELIEKSGISYLGVVPTVVRQLNILFSESRKKKLASLKAILCTGGPLAKDQLQLFYHNYGIPVFNYYGLTETAGICSGHNFETFSPLDNSIGPAVGAVLEILPDRASGNIEGTGELLVKSDNLMSGYFKREAETARVLKNGYFHTGDVVRKREDGCFELLGRKRNIVKNIHSDLIYLEEMDHALESHPLIKEACTCSYARFEEDEKIIAFVVLKESEKMDVSNITNILKKHMSEKVGKTRMPWCYYFEEKLPRNTSGKIQRHLLKEKLHGYIQSHRTGCL